MDQRVHQAIDGELPRKQLSRAEATELAHVESFIQGVVRAVPEVVLPDLGPRVLERIAALETESTSLPQEMPRGRTGSLWSWLLSARPIVIRWRPAYGLGLAAAMALVAVRLFAPPPSVPPVSDATRQVLVQFRLDAPQAEHVALAGDFTNWKPAYTLKRSEPGVWTIVVPLDPGVHDYAFIVDGRRWLADPMAPAVADGFGGLNSRIAVLAPDHGAGI